MFLVLIVTFAFSIATPSFATKYDGVDHTYNFEPANQIMIANLSTARVRMDSDIEAESLNSEFIKKASKLNFRKVIVSSMPLNTISAPAQQNTSDSMAAAAQAKKAALQQEALNNGSDLFIVARLNKYKIGKKLIPAHTEWKEKEETRWVRDDRGREHEETVKIEYPAEIPDTYEPNSTVELLFNVYNPKTGKDVFSRQEIRVRQDSDDIEGVYKRIVDAFYGTMKSLLKHNEE